MRVSGLILIFLALTHFAITHIVNDVVETDAEFVGERWDNPLWRLFDWALLALALLHGVNGVRWSIDDYVKRPGRRATLKAVLYTRDRWALRLRHPRHRHLRLISSVGRHGEVEHLPAVVPVRVEREAGSRDDHPMRKVTREVAFDPASWTAARQAEVGALFDGLAPVWHTREEPGRYDALLDALDRGGVPTDGPVLELGSGIGLSTPLVAEHFPRLIAADLAVEMLRLAPPEAAPRLQCDSTALPFADGALQVVLLVNMLLFPVEMDRVLAADGALVWVNTSGAQTPIHLPAEDVLAALGGGWHVTASEAGTGTWAVARRA